MVVGTCLASALGACLNVCKVLLHVVLILVWVMLVSSAMVLMCVPLLLLSAAFWAHELQLIRRVSERPHFF